jgi:hypothetical protein
MGGGVAETGRRALTRELHECRLFLGLVSVPPPPPPPSPRPRGWWQRRDAGR